MTVQEFINAVSKNPHFLKQEMFIVTRSGKQQGGQLDGGVQLVSSPVQASIIGTKGLLLFVDTTSENAEIFAADLNKWPAMLVCGQVPNALK